LKVNLTILIQVIEKFGFISQFSPIVLGFTRGFSQENGGLRETELEVISLKLRVAKSCFVLLIELGSHPISEGITSLNVIPHETDI
jgi:hypothetical protein